MGVCNLSQKQIKSKNKRFLRLKFENESIIKNENMRKCQKSPPLPYFLKVYKVVSLPQSHFSIIFNFAKLCKAFLILQSIFNFVKSLAKRKFLWYTLGEYE